MKNIIQYLIAFIFLMLIIVFQYFNKAKMELKKEFKEIKIKVEIKGSIIKAGVYEMNEHSRVEDLIKKAQGLSETADTKYINQSKILKDEDVIYIFSKEEIEEYKKFNIKTVHISKECICPKIENKACVSTKEIKNSLGIVSQMNLNTALYEEILLIPGMTKICAKKIIDYRKVNGDFKTIEDLYSIPTINQKTIQKVIDYFNI